MAGEITAKGQIKSPVSAPKESITLSNSQEGSHTWKSILPSCVITLRTPGK